MELGEGGSRKERVTTFDQPGTGQAQPQVPQRPGGEGCSPGGQHSEGLHARVTLPAPRGTRWGRAPRYTPAGQDPPRMERGLAARRLAGSLVPGSGVLAAAGRGSASPQPGTGRLARGGAHSPPPG